MFEGHDTTASGIVWALYNLARHPEHQEMCRREVDAVLNEKDEMDWWELTGIYMYVCISPPCMQGGPATDDVSQVLHQGEPATVPPSVLPRPHAGEGDPD